MLNTKKQSNINLHSQTPRHAMQCNAYRYHLPFQPNTLAPKSHFHTSNSNHRIQIIESNTSKQQTPKKKTCTPIHKHSHPPLEVVVHTQPSPHILHCPSPNTLEYGLRLLGEDESVYGLGYMFSFLVSVVLMCWIL